MAQTAADWARAQVEAVRDDPQARRSLAERTYQGRRGRGLAHRSYRRAELAFMDWELSRGVLAPTGSPWWRAGNERLLRDGCEALARSRGLDGAPSSPTVERWSAFIDDPTAASWYRAHNASIVAAYLDHEDLAAAENEAERFFFNVILLRVLYAHAMVAAPRLALGWLGPLARPLGDPRVRMTGLFLSLSRVLPATYPLTDDLPVYLDAESRFAHVLDYGVIGPRLQAVYEWSAAALSEPRLRGLIADGNPTYVWPPTPDVWQPPAARRSVRATRRLLRPSGTLSPVR